MFKSPLVDMAPAEEVVLAGGFEMDVAEAVVEVVVTFMSLSRASNLKLVSLKDLKRDMHELA